MNYINKKTVFFNLKMFPNVCKHYLIIFSHVKFTFKKVRWMPINYFHGLLIRVRCFHLRKHKISLSQKFCSWWLKSVYSTWLLNFPYGGDVNLRLFDQCDNTRTTDTHQRHNSKKSEKLGQCGKQNMLLPNRKIWDWD